MASNDTNKQGKESGSNMKESIFYGILTYPWKLETKR
jgi:hypothetical protein